MTSYLYTRLVTCPHCEGEAPLLNSMWLSKEGEQWGIGIKTHPDKTVSFEPYRATNGQGPNGEDPEGATVKRGTGQCVHCKQAIDGHEVKAQSRGDSSYGKWKDRLYCVVAIRHQPKLNKKGEIERFKSGEKKGQVKTQKIRYFRAPNATDFAAIEAAAKEMESRWDEWELEGLIPTENIIACKKSGDCLRYGMMQWYQFFTPRQLLGQLHIAETLLKLKPEIIREHGKERGKAIITYLQFAFDKELDYNSCQTRWEYTRGVIKGTFGRHDYSIKWSFGEMVLTGPNSGLRWGLSQIMDAYKGIASLAQGVYQENNGEPPLRIINGSAMEMRGVENKSVDLICMDPPYYDNVQYSELADYFYVWQKRTLSDLYPGYYDSRLTNKDDEAVANKERHGSALKAKEEYESRMRGIFEESRRVLKDDGLMTLMFTHKTQDAWETLTRSLIDAGWIITSSFPVESESGHSTHQKDLASAASSIFITCRKSQREQTTPASWSFGPLAVQRQIETAVVDGLQEFEKLKLNAVDRMVASYGRALKVLSENWPVMDGDELVTPARAMQEASRVVAIQEIERISQGKVTVDQLDAETRMAVMLLGLWGHSELPYDDALNLSRSLNIALENKQAGYGVSDSAVGINSEERTRTSAQRGHDGFHAPVLRRGSKLRLVLPDQRASQRLAKPQTSWDAFHGLLAAYAEGGEFQARGYLKDRTEQNAIILGLLDVWIAEVDDDKLREQAEQLRYEL